LTGETGVRELRNRVERAVALAAGRWIMPADLFPERSAAPVMENRFIASLGTAREDAEKRHIQRALAMMIVRSPLPEVVRLSEPRHPPCSEIRTRPLGVRPCQAVALHLLP
jgi:hypothetical protein